RRLARTPLPLPDATRGHRMRRLTSAIVLGGAGFLGSWLVEELHAQGIPTLVLDDLSSGYREQVQSSPLLVANLMEVDLRGIIEERGVDAVFHLATSAYVPPSFADPIDDLRRNTTSTLRVLEAAR